MTLTLVALWTVTHRYKSVSGDAELYAVQAVARIHLNLAGDIFLQNGGQDKYTIFSPFYAWWISVLGMRNAALSLAIVFKVWFFAAAWVLARSLSNDRTAFISVAFLIITVGSYGAFGVFRYAEDWLTARSLAEALVVSGLALHFARFRVIGLLVVTLAVFVHPLMALPGLLVIICLWFSFRFNVAASTTGVLASLGVALWAFHKHSRIGPFAIMDPEWYEVVRERSVFLFLQYWTIDDWISNARPFLSLAIAAIALPNEQIRKLCVVSMLVGVAGLAIAFISSVIGPVAIMIQGQAWRWEWVTCFVSVLLLAPAAAGIFRDPRCGPLCAALLVAGWTFPPVNGTACITLALFLWRIREHIVPRTAVYFSWAAGTVGIIVVTWTVMNSWSTALAPAADSGRELLSISRVRNILGLQAPAVMLVILLSYWISNTRSLLVISFIVLLMGTSAAIVLPWSLKDTQRDGAATEISEFSDWRNAIPPNANVFVAPAHNSATFAWFTLQRPSYLSVDQSAGVVFSRATAMEVKRRSNVLLPLLSPDWRLLSGSRATATNENRSVSSSQVLTPASLIAVCRDPHLDFVVAKENVGFQPAHHEHRGDWKDWNLYDCRHVRAVTPPI